MGDHLNGGSGEGGTPEPPEEQAGSGPLAGAIRAFLEPIPAILHAWDGIRGVGSVFDYVGRRLLLWLLMGVAGLVVGGLVGLVMAVGSLIGLLVVDPRLVRGSLPPGVPDAVPPADDPTPARQAALPHPPADSAGRLPAASEEAVHAIGPASSANSEDAGSPKKA